MAPTQVCRQMPIHYAASGLTLELRESQEECSVIDVRGLSRTDSSKRLSQKHVAARTKNCVHRGFPPCLALVPQREATCMQRDATVCLNRLLSSGLNE